MQRRLAAALALACLVPAAGCASLPSPIPRGPEVDARSLEGGWHVLASTFPMWLDGKKTDPIFVYRFLEGGGPEKRLDDTVAYTESGRREIILGTDTQDPAMSSHFTWRGKGLLAAFSSDWVVMAAGPSFRWLILYFTKTIGTPEGVDVISRGAALSPEERAAVSQTLAAEPFLAARSRAIVWLRPPSAD